MLHSRLLLGALGAAALVTAGCGSSSNDGNAAKPAAAAPAKQAAAAPATPAPTAKAGHVARSKGHISHADYVQRADRICAQADRISARANQAVSRAYAKKQPLAAADAIDKYGPKYRDKIAQLEALPMPKTGAHLVLALYKVMNHQVMSLANMSHALRTNNAQALQQLSEDQQQSKDFAATLSQGIGLGVCGR